MDIYEEQIGLITLTFTLKKKHDSVINSITYTVDNLVSTTKKKPV